MFNFEQLDHFSQDCLFLRKALRDGCVLSPAEYEVLRNEALLLLAALEKCRQAKAPEGGPSEQQVDHGDTGR